MIMLDVNITTTGATNSNSLQSAIDPYDIVGVGQIELAIESSFLILISSVAFTANASLWLVVMLQQDLRTESNVLILCLSLADLLVAMIGAPITVSSIISSRWLFGRNVCTFVGYMNMLTFVASVQSLGVISLNRYFKICRPAKYLDIYTFRNVGFMFVGVWVYSGLLSIPPLIGWASYDFLPLASICFCDWTASPTYAIFMILMCFCVPCFAMILCYVAIIKAFLRSKRTVMAFASSVKAAKPHPTFGTSVAPFKITANGTNKTRATANGNSPATVPDTNISRRSTGMSNGTPPPGRSSVNLPDKGKSKDSLKKTTDSSRRESRKVSEGFTFSSAGNHEEIKLNEISDPFKVMSDSPLPPQQGSTQDLRVGDSPFDASNTTKGITGTVETTTAGDSDYNRFSRINDPSYLHSAIENDSLERSTLLENKLEKRSQLNRSHSHMDLQERCSTEYGTIGAADIQYNRSISEVIGPSESSNHAPLLTVRPANPLHFTTGQHDGFEQAANSSSLNMEHRNFPFDGEPLRSGKIFQRSLLSRPMLLPSVDSLNPFQSLTPSSASTSLASSDFSSSSNQQIPLSLFQISSQHSPTVYDKPSSPTVVSLRISKSEEQISKPTTEAVSEINSNINRAELSVQQQPLGKSSKALSVSSPMILSSPNSGAKRKTQQVIHSQKRSREEFQLAGSLLVVILIFIICWLPYCVSMVVSIFSTSSHALDMTSLLLGYMNSCVNPIVYGLMNRRFKIGYRKLYVKLLKIVPCSRNSKVLPVTNISKSNSSIS